MPVPVAPSNRPPTGPLFDLHPPQIRFDYIEKKGDNDQEKQT